jgi:tetratricopeptide (TPR) repeat protein
VTCAPPAGALPVLDFRRDLPKVDRDPAVSLFRKKTYDRADALARAARAARRRGRRSRRKAIALLRQVLAHEPGNADLQRKLAALLARDGQPDEAWTRYQRALGDLSRRGFTDQAIGLCREAAGCLPREPATWRELAALQVARGRKADAIASLLEGRAHFRARSARPQALELLRAARRIDPLHLEAGVDLARLLARSGARAAALEIAEELLRAHPRQTRRLCALRLRVAPDLRSACRWLRALCARSAPVGVLAHSGRAARSR